MDLKLTRAQKRVLELLQESNQAVSAQDIYANLRDRQQSVGLATVYRALDMLKVQGLVKSLTLPSGESVYSPLPTDRHHLNCVNCGASLPIDACPIHDLEHELDQHYRFKIYYHTLEFFGLCNQCQAQQESLS